ncbi:hypothetical protein JOF29_004212 [Kribbella aluminosa]|uniref:Uncharacterized protein n=1 Tax=Kribbella aluminosa TaxID=416017 RepID=A0ABS4UNF2_9ACTN|nr:hypothetical protein [Kribbella aluminosa]MBP2353129.1 hypothetical protein [Kribbella aluminosa]
MDKWRSGRLADEAAVTPAYDDGAFEVVTLPHTVVPPFSPRGASLRSPRPTRRSAPRRSP